MPYAEYDPLTTLRGMQAVTGMQDARQERKMRALQLLALQKQMDEQEQMKQAAKSAVVPQQAPRVSNGLSLNGVDISTPTSAVEGPPALDRGKYLANLQNVNPLVANDQAQAFATQDAARQKQMLEFQNSLADLVKKKGDAAKTDLDNIKTSADVMGRYALRVKSAPPEQKAQVYQQVLAEVQQQPGLAEGLARLGLPAQYDPSIEPALDGIIRQASDVKTAVDDTFKTVQLGSGPQGAGVYGADVTGAPTVFRGALPKTVAPAVRVSVNGGGGATGNTAKEIADAIVRGEQPPTTTGLYRYGAAVRGELAKQNFNLAHAEADWKAVQKHLSTMNGPAQERLRQAVSFAYGSLDQVESLYGEWKKAAGVSGVKVFNRASLATSKQLPGEAGAIATNLEALINDFTSEMGTVYKGGNSSTDETLRLAAGNLKADWNEETFARAVKQLRQSLTIRKNSYMNSEAIGVSANSPYAPTQPGAVDLGAAPAGKAEGSTGTMPDGTKVVIHGGRIIRQ